MAIIDRVRVDLSSSLWCLTRGTGPNGHQHEGTQSGWMSHSKRAVSMALNPGRIDAGLAVRPMRTMWLGSMDFRKAAILAIQVCTAAAQPVQRGSFMRSQAMMVGSDL